MTTSFSLADATTASGLAEFLTEEQRTWVHPQSEVVYLFKYPFPVLDREADLCAAYAKFEQQLKEV
ncbi:hypothetical protein [Corynebacterium sp. A21]|uniref:hypothetical protein n=1 Tax=Corynebacterium sp. A21 TaxID=3457318 RepID=UPI003FD655A3